MPSIALTCNQRQDRAIWNEGNYCALLKRDRVYFIKFPHVMFSLNGKFQKMRGFR